MSNHLKFALVALTVNLHTLRNLSFVAYIAVYAVVFLLLTIEFFFRVAKGERGFGWGPFVSWIIASISGTVMSLATISPNGALTGLSRFLFAIPVFLALYLYTNNLEQLRGHIKTLVVFFGIASATLPMQLLTGPIPWFAGATERAGLDRYASLVGSLTSIGIIVGVYLILTYALAPHSRPVWMMLIAVCAVMSLSKAAIANVAIAFAILLFMNRRQLSRSVFGLGLVGVLGVGVYSFVPSVQERVDAVLVSFGVQNSAIENFDVSAEESLIDRLVSLPAANVQVLATFDTPFIYIFGAGFGMANTALVPADDALAEMAHNQYVEVFTVFGAVGAVLLIGALIVILMRLIRLHRRIRSDVTRAVVWAYILLLGNGLAANGVFYQPAAASVFFLAMYCAIAAPFLAAGEGALDMSNNSERNKYANIR